MHYLKPAADPEAVIQSLAMDHQPPIRRMYRPGYQELMARMPYIDAMRADQGPQIAATKEILTEIGTRVTLALQDGSLNLPDIANGEFGRVILAIEEPARKNGEVVPGAEVVLALWGKGFYSPVHGHAPGFINESLLRGAFDVNLFERVGGREVRQARYSRTIQQRQPGIFYEEFVQNVGDDPRSSVIHNFRAIGEGVTASLHYLPEHVRDGNANRFNVVNTPESAQIPDYINTIPHRPGFKLDEGEYKEVEPSDVLDKVAKEQYGTVYLVRSDNVSFLGVHYVIITGSMTQKIHGFRPQDKTILVPRDEITPFNNNIIYDKTVRILELSSEAQKRFYKHYGL